MKTYVVHRIIMWKDPLGRLHPRIIYGNVSLSDYCNLHKLELVSTFHRWFRLYGIFESTT